MSSDRNGLEIAIVGLSGRFPGASNPEELWTNICQKKEGITFFSDQELLELGVKQKDLDQKNYVRAAGTLNQADCFDASFFGVSPREAEIMDPQHRVFLECAWEALENAGICPDHFNKPIGVFAGVGENDYFQNLCSNPELIRNLGRFQLFLGNGKDFLATRVCYKLNLEGPGVVVQTACSTSLVAVHLACQNLNSGECDAALAGGVFIRTPLQAGYLYQEEGILSPDGHCKAFDSEAQGTVPGSGVGVVVLKRLDDALQNRDHIYAVIKGSAINNDGSHKIGYTAPRVDGQSKAIRMAQFMADVPASSITYIESHGTGTALGDPIEIEALTQAFQETTREKSFCYISSLKSNVGHLDAAAGISGLIKASLALHHKKIPPSLHFNRPNPKIDFQNTPFIINNQLRDWTTDRLPRRAGVSSFGIGGTNAHLILEEAPPVEKLPIRRSSHLLTLSARSEPALKKTALNLKNHLESHPELSMGDVAYTLQNGRKHFRYRKSIVCNNIADAINQLQSHSTPTSKPVTGIDPDVSLAFMFPGQGSQYPKMGYGIYQNEPVFQREFDRCCEILHPILNIDLREVIHPKNVSTDTSPLHETRLTQPALFSFEYALAQLWMSWGIHPTIMIGHSIGEYVAACLAGVFELEDGLKIVAERGSLIQKIPSGSMLAIPLPEEKVLSYINQDLSLAAVNSPMTCTVSGPLNKIEELQKQLSTQNIQYRFLHTSHAFHSYMLDPVLPSFRNHLDTVRMNPPKIPWISNLTGKEITLEEATSPQYWVDHLRKTVRFSDGIETITKNSKIRLLEVGPGNTLTQLARKTVPHPENLRCFYSVPHPKEEKIDINHLMETLGSLWVEGASVSLHNLYSNENRHSVPLPTYPFERERHWITPSSDKSKKNEDEVENTAYNPDIGNWFYFPSWKQSVHFIDLRLQKLYEKKDHWLVFAAPPASSPILTELKNANQNTILVEPGNSFEKINSQNFRLNPTTPDDYRKLISEFNLSSLPRIQILHFWNLTHHPLTSNPLEANEQFKNQTIYPLLYLLQSLFDQGLTQPIDLLIGISNSQQFNSVNFNQSLQALILGIGKVAVREFPNLHCTCLGIQENREPKLSENLVKRILSEFPLHPEEKVILYSENQRLLPTFETEYLPELDESRIPGRLRENGIYTISGGSGSMGLAFGKYLAQTTRGKIALLSRTQLPPRNEWENILKNKSPDNQRSLSKISFDLNTNKSEISQIAETLARNSPIKSIHDWGNLKKDLNLFCSLGIYHYFVKNLKNFRKGESFAIEEIHQNLKVTPKLSRFFDFMIQVLVEDQYFERKDNILTAQNSSGDTPDFYHQKQVLEQLYPEFRGYFKILAHCVEQYAQAFSGEIPSISVIYPDGTPKFLLETNALNVEHTNEKIYLQTAAEIVEKIARKSKDTALRILEVGSGTGQLSRILISKLKGYSIEYVLSDLGKSFIHQARKVSLYQEAGFVDFKTFDISQSGLEQGFSPDSFDIVIGYNVVHATRDIEKSVQNLKELLAPQGLLCLIEDVYEPRWMDMVWGLADGWWYYCDVDLRKTGPLIPLEKWEEVLKKLCFEKSACFPQTPQERQTTQVGLILAQKSELSRQTNLNSTRNIPQHGLAKQIQSILEMEKYGAEVQWIQADVTKEEDVRKAAQQIHQQWGQIHGIIHTAGILEPCIIQNCTPFKYDQGTAAKVEGTLLLNQYFGRDSLDFFVLCGSLSAHHPLPGQTSYCSANNFLDAFAHYNTFQNSIPTVSIDWGFWQEVGMAAKGGMSEEERKRQDQELQDGPFAQAGIEILKRILNYFPFPQIIISPTSIAQTFARIDNLIIKPSISMPLQRPIKGIYRQKSQQPIHSPQLHKNSHDFPENSYERVLRDLWCNLLGLHDVKLHDNFFDLGGDSLMGLTLMSQIQQRTGHKLSVNTLFTGATIQHLSRLLNSLGPLQTSNGHAAPSMKPQETPFFFIHGEGDNILAFRDLAGHMRKPHPFYGIKNIPYSDVKKPETGMSEITEISFIEIKEIQKEGPYYLGGHCSGALIAFEAAHRLLNEGHTVDRLIFLDPPIELFIPSAMPSNASRSFHHIKRFFKMPAQAKSDYARERVQSLINRFKRWRFLQTNPQGQKIHSVISHHLANYRIKPFPGSISIFIAKDSYLSNRPIHDLQKAWSPVCSGDLKIHQVDGNHNNMVKNPYAKILAGQIQSYFPHPAEELNSSIQD